MNALKKSRTRRILTIGWSIFVSLATILGFVNDTGLKSAISSSWLWAFMGLLVIVVWIVALLVVLNEKFPSIFANSDLKSIRGLLRESSLHWPFMPKVAKITFWGLPVLIFGFSITYGVYWAIPPSRTVVLVADFVDPTGVDSAGVTQTLVEGIQETLRKHPEIEIRRLKRPISPEMGRKSARKIGMSPKYKASFVIWGDYVLNPEPEMHMRFDMLPNAKTGVQISQGTNYGPQLTLQPYFFDFKISLSQYMGQTIASIIGLVFLDSYQYDKAIPYFNTALHGLNQPWVDVKMRRMVHFYRGLSYLSLGYARKAESDLRFVIPDVDSLQYEEGDEIALSALTDLGLALFRQGKYISSQACYEKALKIYRDEGDRSGEAWVLGNLAGISYDRGDYEAASNLQKRALALFRELGATESEAMQLSNQGLIEMQTGDYSAAKASIERALVSFRKLGNRLGEADQLSYLGAIALLQGDFTLAKTYLQKALAIDRKLGYRSGEATTYGYFGDLAIREGNFQDAEIYFVLAVAIYHEIGDLQGEAIYLGKLGIAEFNLRKYSSAEKHLDKSIKMLKDAELPIPVSIQNTFILTKDNTSKKNDVSTEQP